MTDQTKLRKRLEALLKLPENQVCADCGKRGPRWASANLGVFMCIECSGIHRNLGVHISFVRSVNLDSWTVLQVQFMEEWGNGRANKYYEANVPREYLRPKENDSVRNIERFIRDKYEHKRFIASSTPPKSNTAEDQPVEQPKSRSTVKASANPAPTVSKPKQVVAPAPAAPEPNLLDFMDTPPPPAHTAATNHTFPPTQQQQQQPFQQAPVQSFAPQQQSQGFTQGGFGDFGPPVSFPGSQGFGGGGAPVGYTGSPQMNGAAAIDPFLVPHPQTQPLPPAAPMDQQPPVAPKQSADAILSLYSVPATNYGGPQGGMGGHGMGISMMGGGGGGGYPGGPMMQMMPMPNQGGGYPRPPMPMGAGGMMPNPGGYPPAATGYPQQQQHQQSMSGYGFPHPGGMPQQQQQQQQQQHPGFPTQQQQQQQQPNMGMGMGMAPSNFMNQQQLPRGAPAQPYGQLPVQQNPSYMPQQQQQQQQYPGAMGMGLPYSNVQAQAAAYGMMPPNAMQQPPGGGGFPNYGGAR